MKRAKLLLLGAATALALSGTAARAAIYTIQHVTVIDGTGRAPQPDMTVVVDGQRITTVTPSAAAGAPQGNVIDGTGKYLIPGLMDVHIHLRGWQPEKNPDGTHKVDRQLALSSLASYIYEGVTTVFDAGNQPENILEMRRAERAGEIQSPRIFATGNLVTYPGSHGDAMAVRISDFEKDKALLDKHIAEQKPDMLKLTYDEEGWGARPMITLMPTDLLQQIIEYYNEHGIRTTVHVSNEKRAIEAIYAGIDTLAHPDIQGPVSDNFVRLMAARKTPFATTLTIGENYSRLVEHPEYLDRPDYVASVSAAERQKLKTETLAQYKARSWTWWMKLMTPICEENIRKIVAAGGVAALGTDQSSGPAAHREMELLVQAGIPALEVIKIATLNGAVFLGKADELGSVETGKLADLVLLNSNPIDSIDNSEDIAFVVKNGAIIDESKLPLAGGPQKRRFTGRP
ncbi:amidohydrolase family protein [Flavisphingomonas formosensis]|uniref:amidohydrolase family protein n=1 Tax=Flavisphingomonas formosensis TaxID=861534 RepID=UPI0012FC5C66|nr:amidohydrolase family protein [Sphingomonas formosensis]